MAFVIVPNSDVTDPVGAFSRPNMVSFCVADSSGAGGSIYVNAAGVVNAVVTDAVDLKTFFVTTLGVPFNSIPLVAGAFKPVNTNQKSIQQFVRKLEINFFGIASGGAGAPLNLRFGPLFGLGAGPSDAYYVQINAPTGGAINTWRVTLKLRHSITN